MGIHDITTMNEVAIQLKQINPNIFVYGEGWTASDSPLPIQDRGIKANIPKMPLITAFSDELRDGLKGSVFEDHSTGFISGGENTESSIQFGVVGCIQHPQIDYNNVNYSKTPWAVEPWQSINYVSCHDNHTLYDKLAISRMDQSEEVRQAMDLLAMAVVMTSQGTAFLHAGGELLRTKKGSHNSYNLPDSINQIDWNWKVKHAQVYEYYKNLITLRKTHPAFFMKSADDIRQHLFFETVEDGLISFQLKDHANGDPWKNILVIYNAGPNSMPYYLQEDWLVAVSGTQFYTEALLVHNKVELQGRSMTVLYQL